MKQVRIWGFDYLKLDFLYAGALPGVRHKNISRETAYRTGLQEIREALGADAYLLTCGAPILPSLGLCDALRIGPDVAGEWESYRDATLLYNPTIPGTKNAIRTTANRLWLRHLVATDPDVVYFCSHHNTLTAEQKRMLQDLAFVCNFKTTSDLPKWLRENLREELRTFLEANPKVKNTGRNTFSLNGRKFDFGLAMPVPNPPSGLSTVVRAALSIAGNQGWAMKLLDEIGKRKLKKMKSELY